MSRASGGDFLESSLFLFANCFVEFDMHLDVGENSMFVLLRLKLDLDLSQVPSLPLRIHAHGDANSGPQRPQKQQLRGRPRIVSSHRSGFIHHKSMSPDEDLVLEISQEANGHIAAHRPPPMSKSL